MIVGRDDKLFLQNTKSPASTAISVPPAMATPTLALAMAGESFVPSPINKQRCVILCMERPSRLGQ